MQLVKESKVFYKLYSFWGILALGALPFLEQYGAPIVSQIPAQYQPIASAVLALIVNPIPDPALIVLYEFF